MSRIREIMESHHKRCDEAFANAEEQVQSRDWRAAEQAFSAFVIDIEAHFRVEENVLFPEYEIRSGMNAGPTRVMCLEHSQMRTLLQQLKVVLDARNWRAFGGYAETLLILMQQHNMKEENILYPMCDESLGADAALQRRLEQALQQQIA